MVPLQYLGAPSFGTLVLAVVVPFLVVLFGTYLGVLGALQSFFDASSWKEAVDTEDSDA
ncbi:hypothetical protein [Haloarchaeobius sp. HRN-SO-5]|uniref:hypothetical protein n=1 Tax=Haloarchaeobius sp. HRN-SO-5 TaxID=3446118 RepID=UPI003EB8F402